MQNNRLKGKDIHRSGISGNFAYHSPIEGAHKFEVFLFICGRFKGIGYLHLLFTIIKSDHHNRDFCLSRYIIEARLPLFYLLSGALGSNCKPEPLVFPNNLSNGLYLSLSGSAIQGKSAHPPEVPPQGWTEQFFLGHEVHLKIQNTTNQCPDIKIVPAGMWHDDYNTFGRNLLRRSLKAPSQQSKENKVTAPIHFLCYSS